MKLITYLQGSNPRCGLALNERVGLDLPACLPTLPGNWHGILPNLEPVHAVHQSHTGPIAEMDGLLANGQEVPLPFFDLKKARILTPVILPSKIIAVGMNYRDHAEGRYRSPSGLARRG